MKKITVIILILLSSTIAWAQSFENFTVSPAVFTAEDQFTLRVDVTGTSLAGQTDIYIWAWCNAGVEGVSQKDAVTNGEWGNSNEDAKLTHVEGNIFTFTATGVNLFELTPGELSVFNFLLKTKNGSAQTNDSRQVKFDPLIFVPAKQRVFPAKVSAKDVVSLYFHQDLATNSNEQRMAPKTVIIEAYDAGGNIITPAPLELDLRRENTTTWRASFLPVRSFTAATPVTIKYRFKGTIQNTNNEPQDVLTEFEEFTLMDLK